MINNLARNGGRDQSGSPKKKIRKRDCLVLTRAFIWAFCLPLLPVCWLQLKRIRRQPPKMNTATLPVAGARFASTSSAARRVLGLGDQGILGAGDPDSDLDPGPGLAGYCAEALMRQSDDDTSWQVAEQGGATVSDLLARCREMDHLNVDLILICVGINDVTGLTSLMRWQAGIFDLIFLIRQKGAAKIIFLGLPPMARFEPLPQPLRAVCGVRAGLLDAVLKRSVSPLGFAAHLDFETIKPLGILTDDGYHLTAPVQKGLGAAAASLGLRLMET